MTRILLNTNAMSVHAKIHPNATNTELVRITVMLKAKNAKIPGAHPTKG